MERMEGLNVNFEDEQELRNSIAGLTEIIRMSNDVSLIKEVRDVLIEAVGAMNERIRQLEED